MKHLLVATLAVGIALVTASHAEQPDRLRGARADKTVRNTNASMGSGDDFVGSNANSMSGRNSANENPNGRTGG
ncbi:hypothetical protein [Bradyrhizobium sp. 2TAF24]|uniref:hypothetical protein n=1 Tax=Bradyrhizobium sp. 2TAF24 TaxID=3233011 RepID=UPI003F8E8976